MTQRHENQSLDNLLLYLKRTHGFDFTGYKQSSLQRRIQKRMEAVGTASYDDYQRFLEQSRHEMASLFDTILIKVTSFFRDPDSWEYLATSVLPAMLDRRGLTEPIRAWCVGCASGQEAYTLAMVLCEALGLDRFRERVKIYATDLDEDALAYARRARYTPREIEGVPQEVRDRYFEVAETGYTFRSEVRRAVVFGRHDVVQDAPISQLDLLLCRNTLMYFEGRLQARVLGQFHFALRESGILFLGRAEMLLSHQDLFSTIEPAHHIFRKLPKRGSRSPMMHIASSDGPSPADAVHTGANLRDATFEAAPPMLTVGASGELALANRSARALFAIAPQQIGQPFRDLDVSYRPIDLRSLIDEARAQRRVVTMREVELGGHIGGVTLVDVLVTPLLDGKDQLVGTSVEFLDVSRLCQLRADIQKTRHDLETAQEELQSTNEELRSTNEELATTNEELQCTVEELEATNEELQSTNEELETINDELRERTDQVTRVKTFLEAILGSLSIGVAVLNHDQQVLVWNTSAERMWGLAPVDVVGRHVLSLDCGLPVEKLKADIRAILTGEVPRESLIDATDGDGRSFVCSVAVSPLRDLDGCVEGAILVMADTTAQDGELERADSAVSDARTAEGSGVGDGPRG